MLEPAMSQAALKIPDRHMKLGGKVTLNDAVLTMDNKC